MKTLINRRLAAIAVEHNITILYACESGSRAWGFPSPDSDYDVRFIYVHKPDWYLSLKEGKDTINLPIDEHELDITGWELKKALKLVQKSNASPLEWVQSPIVYQQHDVFKTDFNAQCKAFFSSIAVAHHFQSMALKYVESLSNKDQLKLKSCFYALRTSLCVSWIIKHRTMPPIVFKEMLELVDDDARQRILDLMEIKKQQNESYLHPYEAWMMTFLTETLKRNKVAMDTLVPAKGDFRELNQLFLKTVKRHS